MLEGGPHRVRGQERGRAAQGGEAIGEGLVIAEAERVARRGVGEDDHGGTDLAEGPGRPLQSLAIGARALFHAGRASRGAEGRRRLHSREVHADPGGRHAAELGLHRGIAGREEHADARAPAEHGWPLFP